MNSPLDFKQYQSILCLNGDLPRPSFFKDLNYPIIAADGAANSLAKMGIKPYIIIGDLDSLSESDFENNKSLYLPEQNTNDYQKSLCYLQTRHLLPAIIIGINGGCLDHILNNINIFMNTNCLLYAPPLKGFVLNAHNEQELSIALNSKISLLAIPNAVVSSQGMQWELNKAKLSFPGKNSCFNRSVSETIYLTVHQGSVLVLIYEHQILDAALSSHNKF